MATTILISGLTAEVMIALDGLTTTSTKSSDGQSDRMASVPATAVDAHFYEMAQLSIAVQATLQKKQAA